MQATQLDVTPLAGFFKALGDDTRVRIVALLCHGELCVCHIVAALDLPQSTVSRQLSVLKNAGLVDARREGTWVYYKLAAQADGDCKAQLRQLTRSFGRRSELRADVERLLRSRGPESCR